MNRIYKKITIIALSLITFVSFVFVTNADTQTSNEIRVYISSRYGYETIHAKYGDSDYLFYTFDKVTNKVPAPNKWYRVPNRGIDISLIKGTKNIYFANSTIPSVNEVVKVTIPAQPKLSKASYDVWSDKLVVLSGTKDVTDRASVNGILTNSSGFATTFADIIEDAKCNNGNISVSLGAVNSEGKAVDRVELDFSYNNASGFYEIGNVQSRSLCGAYKTVKVLKRPAAPVVTVDYNNHFFKVAGNVEVTKVASKTTAPVYEEGKGLLKGVTKGKFTYYFVGDETGYYCARTKEERGKKLASLDSEFEISAMPDCKSKVSVIGRNKEDAILDIRSTDGMLGMISYSFQYAIVDSSTMNTVLTLKDNKYTYDYEKAVSDKGKSLVSWKNANQTEDFSGVKKYPSIKILKKKIPQGGCILVRDAAQCGRLSSKIMVLLPPTNERDYWICKKVGETASTNCVSMTTPQVNSKDRKIEFTVYNGKERLNTEIYDYIAITSNPAITLNGRNATPKLIPVNGTDNVKIEIHIPLDYNADASRFTLVINSGFVSDSGYSKTTNLVGDLKAPEVKSKTPTASWKAASDKKSATVTMKVTFTEKLAKEEDGEYVLLTSGTDLKNWFAIDKDAYTLDSAIYTSGGTPYITVKFTYDLTKAASEAGNVSMVSGKKLYDKVGYELTWPGIVVKANSKMVQWK